MVKYASLTFQSLICEYSGMQLYSLIQYNPIGCGRYPKESYATEVVPILTNSSILLHVSTPLYVCLCCKLRAGSCIFRTFKKDTLHATHWMLNRKSILNGSSNVRR